VTVSGETGGAVRYEAWMRSSDGTEQSAGALADSRALFEEARDLLEEALDVCKWE